MKRIALLLALAAAGCQTMQTRPIELAPTQLAAIQADVAARLKDPESARFGRIAAGRAESGVIKVCGLVNGRNSFGAYGNESAFTGLIDQGGSYRTVDIASLGAGASWAQAILNNCRADGVPV